MQGIETYCNTLFSRSSVFQIISWKLSSYLSRLQLLNNRNFPNKLMQFGTKKNKNLLDAAVIKHHHIMFTIFNNK